MEKEQKSEEPEKEGELFESYVSSVAYAALSNNLKMLQKRIEELEIENDKLKERNQDIQFEKWSLEEKLEQIRK